MRLKLICLIFCLNPFLAYADEIFRNWNFIFEQGGYYALADGPNSAVGDNFTLGNSATIRAISFAGIYTPVNRGQPADSFIMAITTSSGGANPVPADIVAITSLSGERMVQNNSDYYTYELNLDTPINLSAGDYFMLIQNNTGAAPDPSWGLNGIFAAPPVFPGVIYRSVKTADLGATWQISNFEIVFRLYDETFSAGGGGEPELASFDLDSQILTVPVVEAGADYYRIELRLLELTTGTFQIVAAEELTNPETIGQAEFDLVDTILRIPEVVVGSVHYRVELTLTDMETLRFTLTFAEEL